MASREEIASLFDGMAGRADPAKLQGMNAAIQFDLAGESGGLYWLTINDGAVAAGEGAVENAKMTLSAGADDFLAVINGTLNPMQAFMTGKIKIKGDTGLAMKLMPLLS